MTDDPRIANTPPEPAEKTLESWKEIAAHLKRQVRTVRRWEKTEGLPVRRHLHQARSTVYAYPSELDAWWAARRPAEEPEAEGWLWTRPVRLPAFAMTLLLALLTAGGGLIHPSTSSAQGPGIVTKRVWSGLVDVLGAPSPDGRFLSFVHWPSGNLAIRDLARDESRQVTNEGTWDNPSSYAYYSIWSPDGRKIAYTWFNKDKAELRLVGLEGGPPTVLYRDAEAETVRPHSWSSDGKAILALLRKSDGANQIVLVSVPDGFVRVLKSLDWRYPIKMSLSPDGKYVVYDFPPSEDSQQRDIFLLDTDGGREIPLVRHPGTDYGPLWAPDGKSIVFASDRSGSLSAWSEAVVEGKPVGPPQLIKQNMDRLLPMGFSREGVLYYAHVVFENSGDVYLVPLEPATHTASVAPEKAVQRFEGWNTSPAWSLDGKYIAYVSQRGPLPYGVGTAALVIRNVATGEERELWPKLERLVAHRHSGPRWSPDGKSVLITGRDPKGRFDLFLVDVQSAKVTPLGVSQPDSGRVEFPSWSPDGKRFYYIRRNRGIFVRDLGTGKDKDFYPGHAHNPAVSPDGKLVAFTDDKTVFVEPAEGGTPRALARVGEAEMIGETNGLVWSPDGKHLFFVKGKPAEGYGSAQLWQVSIEGDEARPAGIALYALRDLAMHPRELRIAFTAGASGQKAEVWTMENFLPSLKAAK